MGENRTLAPSAWVERWLGLLEPAGEVLDVACGLGRHSRLAAGLGHRVVAVDRNEEALAQLSPVAGVTPLKADIEGERWPLPGRRFDAVIVTNYLHRPLFARLLDSVTDAGMLVYETFARGNERFGRPSNPEFLLEPGELLQHVQPRLRVLGYEDVYVDSPKAALIQRVCAVGRQFTWPIART